MPKPIIAVDIDDVLAAFAKGFTDFSNKKWSTNLVPDDYNEHWAVVWEVDEEEAKKRGDVIHQNASQIIIGLSHDQSARQVLERLAQSYKLVVVTSRRTAIQKDTLEWINKHFEGIFREIHFAGIWDDLEKDLESRLKATKADVVKQIGADYLVDDQPKHCIAAAEAGITSLLFGDYRWNRNIKLLPNMARAKNWQEVLEYFTHTNLQSPNVRKKT